MTRSVGIDLGTTNSCVAILEHGEPEVIPNAEGQRLTPSVVGFKEGEVLVGQHAKRQLITNPENTVRSIKRHMGEPDWYFSLNGKKYVPQQISAQILIKLKKDAEEFLGEKITNAVITVPAYFNQSQRQATKEAGIIAGLEVDRIINEPTAAALAYGIKTDQEQTILVFDLGGGTFDVSILEITSNLFEVRATSGDTELGGDDWDDTIVLHLLSEFEAERGVDLSGDQIAMQRLKEAAEKAKIELSQVFETDINLPFISANEEGPLHLESTLSRSKFEEITEDLRQRCRKPLQQALEDSELDLSDLDHIVLAGGSTRMPAIRDLVAELTGKEPRQGVNPDEAVASGAALQAGIINQDITTDVVLVDVTPLSLGVDVQGGLTSRIIERNTAIPTSNTETYVTAYDFQDAVVFRVIQGERMMAEDNKSLGEFVLDGLPLAPRGMVKVDVTFSIDANGIIQVTAKERRSGNEMDITITGGSELPQEELDRMLREAMEQTETDQRKKELAVARNRADDFVYKVRHMLAKPPVPIGEQRRAEIELGIRTLEDVSDNKTATLTQVEDAREELESMVRDLWYERE